MERERERERGMQRERERESWRGGLGIINREKGEECER
jgi:hypothetical protein